MRYTLVLLCLTFALGTQAFAQSPFRKIDTLYLAAPDPCPNDSVSVIVEFLCNTGGITDIGTNMTQTGNLFEANEIVCQGLLQVITGFKDTFHLGSLAQGSYLFKCNYFTADASFNCQTATLWDSAAISFNVGPPNAQIFTNFPGSTVTICQGDSSLLQSNTGPNIAYQWLFNGNPIPGATDSTYFASQQGAYQVIVDACNYPDTSSAVNLVFSIPQVALNLPGNACDQDPGYPLSGASPPGGNWSGPYVSGTNFDCFTAPPGAYAITYTFTDAFNCTGQASDTLLVLNSPQVTLNQLLPVCQTDPPFPLSGGLPTGGVYNGPGVSNGMFDPAAAGPGIHLLSYTYTDSNSCSGTASQPQTVNPAPATPTITQAGDTLFSSASSGNQWYNLVGPIPGATGPYFIPTVSGTYYVVTTDGFGCPSRPSAPVTVVVLVSVEEDDFWEKWSVNWIPIAQAIVVRGRPDLGMELALMDLQGRTLLRRPGQTDATGALRLETGHLAAGLYLLRLSTESENLTKRVLVW